MGYTLLLMGVAILAFPMKHLINWRDKNPTAKPDGKIQLYAGIYCLIFLVMRAPVPRRPSLPALSH